MEVSPAALRQTVLLLLRNRLRYASHRKRTLAELVALRHDGWDAFLATLCLVPVGDKTAKAVFSDVGATVGDLGSWTRHLDLQACTLALHTSVADDVYKSMCRIARRQQEAQWKAQEAQGNTMICDAWEVPGIRGGPARPPPRPEPDVATMSRSERESWETVGRAAFLAYNKEATAARQALAAVGARLDEPGADGFIFAADAAEAARFVATGFWAPYTYAEPNGARYWRRSVAPGSGLVATSAPWVEKLDHIFSTLDFTQGQVTGKPPRPAYNSDAELRDRDAEARKKLVKAGACVDGNGWVSASSQEVATRLEATGLWIPLDECRVYGSLVPSRGDGESGGQSPAYLAVRAAGGKYARECKKMYANSPEALEAMMVTGVFTPDVDITLSELRSYLGLPQQSGDTTPPSPVTVAVAPTSAFGGVGAADYRCKTCGVWCDDQFPECSCAGLAAGGTTPHPTFAIGADTRRFAMDLTCD